MGLFNNYMKPGPGIDKNAPKKKGLDLFFDIFKRRIGTLFKLNIIYVLCSLPALILYFMVASVLAVNFIDTLSAAGQIEAESQGFYTSFLSLFFSSLTLTLLGSGPASAAMSYIMRSFIRDEHVWLRSDFFTKTKENFKQGILAAVFDAVILLAGIYSVDFYYNAYINNGSLLWFFAMCLIVILLCVLVFAHFYLYQLMVTFEDKLFRLYKNSFLLAIATLPQCLLAAADIIVVEYLIINTFTPVISVLFILLFLVAFLRFPGEFFAARIIQNKILNNMPQDKETKGSEENDG